MQQGMYVPKGKSHIHHFVYKLKSAIILSICEHNYVRQFRGNKYVKLLK